MTVKSYRLEDGSVNAEESQVRYQAARTYLGALTPRFNNLWSSLFFFFLTP